MKQIIRNEHFDVVVSNWFTLSYKQSSFVNLLIYSQVQFVREFNPFSRNRIQKLSVQLWSVNQRTTEAEEVTDP
jgi:hypothetical protein